MSDGGRFTIFADTREKKPYSFSRYPISVEEMELKTGDYCVSGDGWMENGTFYPKFATERKSASDFLNSITWERDRFERELERADKFDTRMPIIVEQNYQHFMKDNHYKDVHPNSIEATVDAHTDRYYAEYFFTRDRKRATDLTYDFLEWRSDTLQE
jgi:DNA excision repair protein ERCC-4